jgi:hypothetical protein
MRVHGQIAVAAQIQIHRRMFREQREHVVEKRKARFNFGPAFAVKIEADGNFGFERVALDLGLARFHCGN